MTFLEKGSRDKILAEKCDSYGVLDEISVEKRKARKGRVRSIRDDRESLIRDS